MLTVRTAEARDVPALVEVVRAAYTPYVEEIGVCPGPLRTDYAAAVRDHDVRVAERDGAVVGLLVLVPHSDHLLVHNVAVHPSVQGTGVGSLLLDLVEVVAGELGLPEVRLYTHRLMTRNLALYAARGYLETHRETEAGFDRVFMAKRL